MAQLLAPIRKAGDTLVRKATEATGKLHGEDKVQEENTRLMKQMHAASVGPVVSTDTGGSLGETGDVLRDPMDIAGATAVRTEKKAVDEAARAAAEERARIRPLPDEEAIARNRKRANARRASTGRASTVLTDSDGLLGG